MMIVHNTHMEESMNTALALQEKSKNWKQGTKVHANGYDGVIVRQYSCLMWEVRLPGGVACICASDIEPRE